MVWVKSPEGKGRFSQVGKRREGGEGRGRTVSCMKILQGGILFEGVEHVKCGQHGWKLRRSVPDRKPRLL